MVHEPSHGPCHGHGNMNHVMDMVPSHERVCKDSSN